ncbi:hemolysin family protein [bacterium]|nr:hemolysin family protein [bacterium]
MSEPDLPNYLLQNYLFYIIILISFSAFFSASETAFVSFGKHHFQKLLEKDENKSKRLQFWFNDPQRVLATLLVGNNIVNILAAVILSMVSYQRWPNMHPIIITLILTFFILIFGEITPKSFGKKYSETIAYHFSPIIRLFCCLFSPVIRLLLLFSRGFVRIFGLKLESLFPVLTEDDVRAMIIAGEEDGVIEEEEKNMIDSIFSLGDTLVKEIMIPRVNIIAIQHNEPIKEIFGKIAKEGHSRLPVYKENLDKIMGIVYVKDIIAHAFDDFGGQKEKVAENFMREAYFIPETKKVGDLLKELQGKKTQMAIVVDEYGGTSGLITMEDLVEEIVGEISDEYAKEIKELVHLADGSFLVYGGMEIEKVNDEIGLELPEGEFETIAGFVLEHFGKFPIKGEGFVYGSHEFIVNDADHKKVRLVRIKKVKNEENNDVSINTK